mmetsp:Transcript_11597/g.23579  ORF Transcript_11597/g.23579 Transcript_11597/m.23579 type:complete len:721 (-) Transcript_11597:670-2832(-)
MQNALAGLIQTIAGRYVKLRTSDLKLGIGGGQLVVENVELRVETLNGMVGLPVEVVSGRAGRLRIEVPWSALSSAPVLVNLEDVHLLAGPKRLREDHEQDEEDEDEAEGEEAEKWGHDSTDDGDDEEAKDVKWRDRKGGGDDESGRVRDEEDSEGEEDDGEEEDEDAADNGNRPVGKDHLRRNEERGRQRGRVRRRGRKQGMGNLEHHSRGSGGSLPISPNSSVLGRRSDSEEQSKRRSALVRKKYRHDQKKSISPASPRRHSQMEETDRVPWHSTLLGRLAFNVSLELKGLTLEYEDERCQASVRIASLVAHSAGSGWEKSFVPLDPGSGHVIAMRKTFTMKGLTLRMSESIERVMEQMAHENDRGNLNSRIHKLPFNLGMRERSFEETFAILEDVGLVIKVLMCTSTELSPVQGSATEIDIEVDGAHASFSSRQLAWISAVLERANRGWQAEAGQPTRLDERMNTPDFGSVMSADFSRRGSAGPLARLWNYVVGENGYELRDDVADILGFDSSFRSTRGELNEVEAYVRLAAEAGGSTLKVRIVTPDHDARAEVARLRKELDNERILREQLEDVESVLIAAESKVNAAQEAAEQLRRRNDALLNELKDLENLTSEASRNKDAMIRQMESALMKAERNLQLLMQRSDVAGRPPSVAPTSSRIAPIEPELTTDASSVTSSTGPTKKSRAVSLKRSSKRRSSQSRRSRDIEACEADGLEVL